MNPRPFAYAAGTLLLILGIAGFVPPLVQLENDPLRQAAGVGGPQLLGVMPTSYFLSALYAAVGAWGIFAGSRPGRAVRFARRAAILFAVLLILGTIPGLDTLFGAAPLYGNNLLLHGVLAVLCLLFGWLYSYRRAAPDAAEEEGAVA
jgi:heme A synthase